MSDDAEIPDATDAEAERGERIAKWLARAGIASRRDAEKLVAEGRVAINGATLDTPASFVAPGDSVSLDGKPVGEPDRTRLFRYHKPDGLVTTHKDPEGRKTVFEELPAGLPRLVSVGRLDLTSEGLLLLTNDGALSRKLELPDNAWIRRYRARVHGFVDERALAQLSRGITVDGVAYGPIEAGLDSRQGTNAWLTVALKEGKNREVRRVLQHLNLTVTRLIRTAYGPFQLGTLPRGAVEEVNAKVLRDQLGLDAPPRIRRGKDAAAAAAPDSPAEPLPEPLARNRPAKAPQPKLPRARNAARSLGLDGPPRGFGAGGGRGAPKPGTRAARKPR